VERASPSVDRGVVRLMLNDSTASRAPCWATPGSVSSPPTSPSSVSLPPSCSSTREGSFSGRRG